MVHRIHENSLPVQLCIDLRKLKENKAQREDETKVFQLYSISQTCFKLLLTRAIGM